MVKFLKASATLILLAIIIVIILFFNRPIDQKNVIPDIETMERPADISPEDWEQVLTLYKMGKATNADIDFYGKVIDQDGQPVPGAKMNLKVTTYLESLAAQLVDADGVLTTSSHTVESDANGRVRFTGQRGRVLSIQSLSKDGYLCPVENLKSLGYSKNFNRSILPTSEKPMTLILRRRSADFVNLVPNEIIMDVLCDGSENAVDLVQGKSGEVKHPDIAISVRAGTFIPGERYDWTVVLKCRDGGIVVADDDIGMYQAPIDGYRPQISWAVKAQSPDWSTSIDRRFYVKSRESSLYAAIRLEALMFHAEEATITLWYVHNTTGSRILEHEERL